MPEVLEAQEASLEDKMTKAYNLAFDIWKLDEAAEYKAVRKGEEADLVYAWVDGLSHKYYHNVSSGHCSPKAFMDFKVEEWEASVDQEIKKMEKILSRLKRK